MDVWFFFFQAEDGIRDIGVTGVQTCALPISEDEPPYTADDEFLVGDALLVAPVTRPGIEHRHVYLPRGCWFHYWTGERFDGPAHVLAHAPLGEPPLYIRANTAVPMGPDASHTGERLDPLTFLLDRKSTRLNSSHAN